ncbi:MAG: TlpA family protein disulfide reductase [Chloroflexi bacterium]|nr:TlpA family protein disulfide reductase [Chloroflexota bacterium]
MTQGTSTLKKPRRGKSCAAKSSGWLWVGLGMIVLLAWIGWNAWQDSRGTDVELLNTVGTQLGEIAPDFTLPTLDGSTFTLSAQQGKPTIIFFMAYWCGTCIPEAQVLVRLNEEYGNAINIIAIDIDTSSSVDSLNQFKRASGDGAYTWAFDLDQVVTNSYFVRALDTTLILDSDGYVVFRDEWPSDYRTLKNVLENMES